MKSSWESNLQSMELERKASRHLVNIMRTMSLVFEEDPLRYQTDEDFKELLNEALKILDHKKEKGNGL